MAQAVFGSPILEVEGETKALSTTAGYIAVKPGFHEMKLYCASQWRLALSPALLHCLYYNGSTYTEYKTQATDRESTTHVPLDGMTTAHYLYLGFSEPALGVHITMGSNVNAADPTTLDVEYCSTAVALGATIAFTDVAGDSDGTNSGTVTLAQTGVYTWTLPTPDTTWKRSTLGTAAIPLYSNCYWIRFAPSATLSATVDLNEIIPVYRNANYSYQEPGVVEQFSFNTAKVGGLVVIAIAGTPTLDVTWIKH
jgi:hypothetical protein